MKYFVHTSIFMLLAAAGLAQETLTPLHSNLGLIYPDLKQPGFEVKHNPEERTQATSLLLPFIEDFYYAYKSSSPDPAKWIEGPGSGSGVFINSGYARAPLSFGVATFDGVDKNGYPYDPTITNNTISKRADTLTSQPINLMVTATSQTLQPSDSVGFSFYYQSTGYGDTPELNDSLILDFFAPAQQKWVNRVWYKTRNSGPNSIKGDSVFTRAFIWLDSTKYLQDKFQFRFRNTATTTGNFDHWHIDYLVLDKNRSMLADTVYADLTFAYMPTPLLRDYSAMPFEQYITSEMAQTNLVKIRNSGLSQINMTYQYKIDSANITKYTYNGNATILGGYRQNGYSNYAPHAKPPINYTFAPMTDSTDYRITHWMYQSGSSVSDFIGNNDTVVQYQRFRNYYALDDGTAEAGYYVNTSGARMAIKVNVNVPDSFIAMRIYFDPVGLVAAAKNSAGFRISVWPAGSNGPANTVLFREDTITKPRYYNASPGYAFAEYKLWKPQQLAPGAYYIGIQQLADPITIGFDRNTDHRTSFYFDAGPGWTQSTIPGSIMIRPIFGRTLPHPVGINELDAVTKDNFMIYPDPASNQFIIHSNAMVPVTYNIVNALGQQLKGGSLSSDTELVDTSTLPEGIYFLALSANGRLVQQQKIIIQR